jgi:Asp-tRNA(Asn)/Glu-tRNA(Gln) amidotransferase A subunit family amidase
MAVALYATAAFGAEKKSSFQLEEATIADVHRAIMAKQLTATQLVNFYLKRIAAHGGTCVKGGFPTIAVPAGFTKEVYDRAAVRGADGSKTAGDLVGPKAAELPVSIDFLGRPFSEAVLIRIAAAFEKATHHRRPPKEFPRLEGEP